MTCSSLLRLSGAAVLALLLASPCARAASSGIRDNATFFSEQAKAEATRGIADIARRFKKDLTIETFAHIPEDLRQGLNVQDKAALNRVFDQWAVRQARELKVNGVYVLLSREPAHLQVVVGTNTQAQAFTLRDRDTLVSVMLGKLRQKQNDEALLEAVNFVSGAMAGHMVAATRPASAAATKPVTQAAEASSPWGWVIAAVLGFLAAWVVVGVIRAMFSGGTAGGASTGGGFLSSLLGGMLGAAAGMWLYDQFTNHQSSSDSGFDDDRRRGDGGSSGSDSDYTSSGGDFGDSGGGDSGGGDY